MHDRPIANRDQVYDLADGRSVLITGYDLGTRSDPARIAGLIQEHPHVACLVLVVDVSGDVVDGE